MVSKTEKQGQTEERAIGPDSVRQIELRGVNVHNLKQIDLDIPLGQLVVLTGVSGSGKSSLAFDTIFAEGQRRYIESFSATARQYLERIERPDADRIAHVPPAIAIRTDTASRTVSARANVASIAEIDGSLMRLFARVGHVICPDCQRRVQAQSAEDLVRAAGLLKPGTRFQFCFVPQDDSGSFDQKSWLLRGFTRAIVNGQTRSLDELALDLNPENVWIVVDRMIVGKTSEERIAESAETAFREGDGRCLMLVEVETVPSTIDQTQMIDMDQRHWLISRFSRAWECGNCQREFLPPEPRLFEPGFGGGCDVCHGASSPDEDECPACQGSHLRAEALAVFVGDNNLADVLRLTAEDAIHRLTEISEQLSAAEQSGSRLLRDDIHRRLQLVLDLGMGHLTLIRSAQTLSGGQVRRLMLAAAIGSGITGTLCLIDEPSAGLSRAEIPGIISALRRLLTRRNSVIVVDHSPYVLRAADYVVELGPGAGPQGGTVVYAGRPDQATAGGIADSLDDVNQSRDQKVRKVTDWITLTNVTHRNLQKVNVRIPLGVLCVVTGPGGSGKTALIIETLVPMLKNRLQPVAESKLPAHCESIAGGDSLFDIAVVDQSPLSRSSRSNAATWIEVFDEIRDVFAMTAEAKQRGYGPQSFSFNAAQGGRCRACRGTGVLKHDMQFMPDVTLTCPECGGTRFRREILDVKYKGQSIADVLAMSATEAATFFRNHPRLQARLQILKQIGLEYLVLGQPTDTLSGGEAQRLRLASRLTASRGATLLVCDEPTTGLSSSDVVRLIGCFDELLAIGHSVVVIDQSPDLLLVADYVIELGPGSGIRGGRIVAEGGDFRKKPPSP